MVLRLSTEQAERLGVSTDAIRQAKLTKASATIAPMGPDRSIDGRSRLHASLVAEWPGMFITDETIRYKGGHLFCDFVFPAHKVGITLNGWNERLAPVEACALGAPAWHVIPLNSAEMAKLGTLKLALATIAKALRP